MADRTRTVFLLALFLLLALSAGPAAAARPAQDIPAGYELVGENALFQLYAHPETLAFKVVDRRSGYIWNSNLDEKAEGDRLNKTWTAFAQSGISIDYLDETAVSERASITNSNHTIDFRRIDQGFRATIAFLDPGISLDLIVRLEPQGVLVEVPFDSIREEDPAFKLGLLYVYPFFASTRADATPGYMFIPDGSGSLIRFQAETKATNMFYGRYYGTDLGMIASVEFDATIRRPYRLSFPVTGMVHGEQEHAYLAIVAQGAAYGQVHAHPSGIITNFNFLYNAFLYNESYFQATNRSGAGVTTLQPTTNAFDVAIHYRFLTGADADYVGMARSYQQYLVERGDLQPVEGGAGDIGIRLEFLGGEKEKVLFWHRLIPMTTVAQMADILDGLDVRRPEVIYYGWQPLGASTMPPTRLKIDRGLGSVGALRELAGEIAARDGAFSLYLDPVAALMGEGGYSTRRDLAMSITSFNLEGYHRNKPNYYLNLDAISDRTPDLRRAVLEELGAGLALDEIGSVLYSDFKDGHELNRTDAISALQALLAGGEGRTGFYMPNDYMFRWTDAYYDIPLSNSGYIYTTESVPFLQIVLAGYVPCYGPALNFSADLEEDLLRHADFGVYPSFFLTQEATALLLNTRSNWIFTSSAAQWAGKIEEAYAWLNALLGPVAGETIVAREQLSPGVYATTYSNGLQVVVNYGFEPHAADGFTVPTREAILREATP